MKNFIGDKMIKNILHYFGLTLLVLMFATVTLASDKADSKWEKAGKKFGEVAIAVTDASKESWEKTKKAGSKMWDQVIDTTENIVDSSVKKGGGAVHATVEGSKSFWDKVKSTSVIWYKKAKAKVHELTAPSTERKSKESN